MKLSPHQKANNLPFGAKKACYYFTLISHDQ